jgi:hypothetical protein
LPSAIFKQLVFHKTPISVPTGAAFIIVQSANGIETIRVPQQTVGSALVYLRQLGFGEGVLLGVDGSQLTSESILSVGGQYFFRTQSEPHLGFSFLPKLCWCGKYSSEPRPR